MKLSGSVILANEEFYQHAYHQNVLYLFQLITWQHICQLKCKHTGIYIL